jgi:HK97 family phage portal protein
VPTAVLDKFLNRLGFSRNGVSRKANGEVPIIHDGGSNEPSVRVYGSWASGMPMASWTPHAYPQAARAGYMSNSDVYACVSLIASAGKQVKWDDSGKYAASGNLLKDIGGPSFVEYWLSYILLSGNAFIEVVRPNKTADISAIYLISPELVSAEVNHGAVRAEQAVNYWKVRAGHGYQRPPIYPFDPKKKQEFSIVQSKLFNPLDPIYGMAPLSAALMKVDMQNEGQTLMKRVLQRGYSPGWIEAREHSEWNDEQVAQMQQRIRRSKYHGEELFLENAVWHQMGFTPADSGLTDQQMLTKRDIASVFHVDPALIGDTTARTYATYRESRRALYMEAIIPLLTQFRDDWNGSIGMELRSPLDFDRDSFDAISAAREEATDRATKLWTSGLITRNEARADLEYAPPKPGDEFFGPANLVPMDGEASGEEEGIEGRGAAGRDGAPSEPSNELVAEPTGEPTEPVEEPAEEPADEERELVDAMAAFDDAAVALLRSGWPVNGHGR